MGAYFVNMLMQSLIFFSSLTLTFGVGPIYGPRMCGSAPCELPDCWCLSVGTPGQIWDEETPQLVVVSMEGVVDEVSVAAFQSVIQQLKNPDGCPVSGTWFVYDHLSNYQLINQLYNHNVEIGVMPIKKHEDSFWEDALYGDWLLAVQGAKAAVAYLGNIPISEIRGMKAHNREMGGNHQFQAYLDYRNIRSGDFIYDASWPVPDSRVKSWPFTLDFDALEPCLLGHCPFDSYPGIWEYPLLPYVTTDGTPCYTLSECQLVKGHETYKDFLRRNFLTHYENNKTPFTIELDWRLFNTTDESIVTDIREFLSEVLETHSDVYVLNMKEALEWIRHPTNKSSLASFPHWSCGKVANPTKCDSPNCCAYQIATECYAGRCGETDVEVVESQHQFCVECPAMLPVWGNPYGMVHNVDKCHF